MTESYFYGGDTLCTFHDSIRLAQVFHPIALHHLNYVDLELQFGTDLIPITIEIQPVNLDGKPSGWYISHNTGRSTPPPVPNQLTRYRFPMSFQWLAPGYPYAIVIYTPEQIYPSPPAWQYDGTSPLYPRGHWCYSPDNGVTWATDTTNDFMFAEVGKPPDLLGYPAAPIFNFALSDISYYYCLSTLTITVSTQTPIHLTCYHTTYPPRKHKVSRTLRGLTVPWSIYQCFVSYQLTEQEEPGDTLFHTFIIPNWPPYQKRWFTFRGTVDNILSPSTAPILQHAPSTFNAFANTGFDFWPDPTLVPPRWYHVFSGPGISDWEREETDTHSGNYAAKLIATSPSTFTWYRQDFCAHAYRNKTVTFSFWRKGGVSGQMRLLIVINATSGMNRQWNFSPVGSWTEQTFTRYISEDATTGYILCGVLAQTAGTTEGLFDDMSII